ncbi:hypothetical protein E2562_015918 [Oryza meyeriana var. granulata]|uniref:NB-ARC domain-containing protein n=1 Tax=Oryza meyeriana var. granulata TaxID=110450 RepID=A0A6G1CGT8_9ORYZ|nr:hypothetical protein E2562_015918 [Oryza meyeriana var. granulata]
MVDLLKRIMVQIFVEKEEIPASLDHLTNLEHINLEKSMPGLQKISIRSCDKLLTMLHGIEGLENLRELYLFAMPKNFVESLMKGERRLEARLY